MKTTYTLIFGLFLSLFADAQNYTAYSTGNSVDTLTTPQGGICMMGGATENDDAMRWFLQQANGGDILVLRASGSDGYNAYMYNMSGVSINSVTSVVCHNANASSDSFLLQKIASAEGIWFAGGNQWNYVDYWRGTAVDSLINVAIHNRNIVVGGTSAGMAILGGFYFSAQNGSITSGTALSNPYSSALTVDSIGFIHNNYLSDVITDTHYDNPDRKGRHIVFLARILLDYGVEAKGIACEEYTAVCIDTNGIARVFGTYPANDDKAFFIQINCENTIREPENCQSGQALTWVRNSAALVVCKINGKSDGSDFIDLKDWKTTNGGIWENWYVQSAIFNSAAGDSIDCSIPSGVETNSFENAFEVYPNPAYKSLYIKQNVDAEQISLYYIGGQLLVTISVKGVANIDIPIQDYPVGVYLLRLSGPKGSFTKKIVIEKP